MFSGGAGNRNRRGVALRAGSVLVACAGFAAVPGIARGETTGVPSAFPVERYQRLIQKSPFAPATPQEPEAPKASFADQLYVTGIAKLGEKDCVYLSTRDKKSTYSLVSGEPGVEGMELLSVEWSNEVGKTKVKVKKGSETGLIAFDQAVLQQVPPAPQTAAPRAPSPGVPQPPQIAQPAGQNAQQPKPGGPTPEVRRRFRIINRTTQ